MDDGASSYTRFLNGDEKAFAEILDLYADNLIFFLNRYVRNTAVAQELSEDVFVELLIHKHRYNYKTSFKTYLFTIARNKAIDYLRKCARRPESAYECIEDEADTASLEDEFIKQEQLRALHSAMENLPENYRTVLHLIYFENMSYDEAGRVMRKSRKQIENLAYRARGSLRGILEKEDFLYERQG